MCAINADCVWVGRRRSQLKVKPRFEPFKNCVFRVAQTWLNGDFPFASRILRPTQTQSALTLTIYRTASRNPQSQLRICMHVCMFVYICMNHQICADASSLKPTISAAYVCMCVCMYVWIMRCALLINDASSLDASVLTRFLTGKCMGRSLKTPSRACFPRPFRW
jgi:hypothetical protein